jgi:hypothetical protein
MDNYVLIDFLVIDMGDEQDPLVVLGRTFLNTTRAIICIRTGMIYFQFRTEKVRCYFNILTLILRSPRRTRREDTFRDYNTS